MNEADLKVECHPRRPIGGQQVGVGPQGVTVTHVPTGLNATCHTSLSQHRNKLIAVSMIEWGLAEIGWRE